MAEYFREVLTPETRADRVKVAVKALRACKDKVEAIAVTGMSGIAMGAIVAHELNVPLVLVRKNDDSTHAGERTTYGDGSFDHENKTVVPYVVIDDFICSGATIDRVLKRLGKDRCIGVYFYGDTTAPEEKLASLGVPYIDKWGIIHREVLTARRERDALMKKELCEKLYSPVDTPREPTKLEPIRCNPRALNQLTNDLFKNAGKLCSLPSYLPLTSAESPLPTRAGLSSGLTLQKLGSSDEFLRTLANSNVAGTVSYTKPQLTYELTLNDQNIAIVEKP